MKIQYLCCSWQGLIQQLVYLVSRGYYYYCIVELPEKKIDKFTEIDKKLISKYRADKSKYQRARQKNKGIANFYYLRWENIGVIMHTPGAIIDINYDDKFKDLRVSKNRIHLRIGELTRIEIVLGEYQKGGVRKVTVKLDRETYAGLKDILQDAARSQKKWIMVKEFNKLNNLPAWGGIIDQKQRLAKFLVNKARHNQVELTLNDLRINTFRKPVKVFEES